MSRTMEQKDLWQEDGHLSDAALTALGDGQLDIVGDEHMHYDLCVDPHVNVVCTACGE